VSRLKNALAIKKTDARKTVLCELGHFAVASVLSSAAVAL
jgi:hypothetical protein